MSSISMLEQILQEMYVDPELLQQLDEDQRELLFRKMREEQVRRWRSREAELEKREPPKRTKKKISFIHGADHKEWVWVMGEHDRDLPYEELVAKREREEAEKEHMNEMQDRKEAEEMAKLETRDIISLARRFGELHTGSSRGRSPSRESLGTQLSSTPPSGAASIPTIELSTASPGTAQRLKPRALEKIGEEATDGEGGRRRYKLRSAPPKPPQALLDSNSSPESRSYVRTESQMTVQESPMVGRRDGEAKKEEELRKKTIIKKVAVIGTSEEDQRRFQEKRAQELFETMRKSRLTAKKRAAQISKSVEERWKESEHKVRTFERQRKMSIQKARRMETKQVEQMFEQMPSEKMALVRKISERRQRKPSRPAPPRPLFKQASFVSPGTQPRTASHAVQWFFDHEAPKGMGREKDGSISVWFHGLIDRKRAQDILEGRPVGSYIVRLSTKIWGFTVSVKTYTECKHFLVDASSEQYTFVGPKQPKFGKFEELLKFYRVNPVTWAGQEVLLLPVEQEEDDSAGVFQGLYSDSLEEATVEASQASFL